jgi:hypothetical protein
MKMTEFRSLHRVLQEVLLGKEGYEYSKHFIGCSWPSFLLCRGHIIIYRIIACNTIRIDSNFDKISMISIKIE